MSSVDQRDNTAGGDIVAGNKTVYNATQKSRIAELNEKFEAEGGDAEGLTGFMGELQHYWDRSTNADVRGLSAKLTDSDRADLIHAGELLKEKIAKKILRYQTSRHAQDIFVWVFAELYVQFMLNVTPRIQAGADRATVDQLISEKVIDPVLSGLEKNVLALYRDDLLGSLFFLGGNCHIRWDKC